MGQSGWLKTSKSGFSPTTILLLNIPRWISFAVASCWFIVFNEVSFLWCRGCFVIVTFPRYLCVYCFNAWIIVPLLHNEWKGPFATLKQWRPRSACTSMQSDQGYLCIFLSIYFFRSFCWYSKTSLAWTFLGPWKFIQNMVSSNQWGLIMAPGQEANDYNLGYFFHLPDNNVCGVYSLESPQWGNSNEYTQHKISW